MIFSIRIGVPQKVYSPLGLRTVSRKKYFEELWQVFGSVGLSGIHEGTVLTEGAPQGLKKTVLDSGCAPNGRDWVGKTKNAEATLYVNTRKAAQTVCKWLQKSRIPFESPEAQKPFDWNAEWKKSFKGVPIGKTWQVSPPWEKNQKISKFRRILWINPGAGFGTGTHETTHLCLQILGEWEKSGVLFGRRNLDPSVLEPQSALDFGSGSGILSIALAKLGFQSVTGVEIDPLALDNANENAELNKCSKLIRWSQKIPKGMNRTQRLVVANILRPVLVQYASVLVSKLEPRGILLMSGLLEKDLKIIRSEFGKQLKNKGFSNYLCKVWKRKEWRAIAYLPAAFRAS